MPMLLITFVLLGYMTVCDVSAIKVMELDEETCLSGINALNEDSPVHLKWDGRELPSYCKLSFIGRSTENVLNRYRMCVEVLEYDITNCGFKLKYYKGFNFIPSKVYFCYSGFGGLPPKFCADEEDYLDIKFEADTFSSSSVTLKLTATLTYYDGDTVDMTVQCIGGGIAGISGIVIGLIVLYLIYRRRHPRSNPGIVMQHVNPNMHGHDVIASTQPHQPYMQTGQGANLPQPVTTVVQHTTTIPLP